MSLNQVLKYSAFPQHSVSIAQMKRFTPNPNPASLFLASLFLKNELTIRLAHRVLEISSLPNRLCEMPSVIQVKKWYQQSFDELTAFPIPEIPSDLMKFLPSDPQYYVDVPSDYKLKDSYIDYNHRFVQALQNIKTRHDPTLSSMAQGLRELKSQTDVDYKDTTIQTFLDRFYMSRIGIRMLIGQHVSMISKPPRENYVGIICTKTSIREIAVDAIDDARWMAEEYYGIFKAPVVDVIMPKSIEFTYVPSHLHHMLFELIKNSLRATIETHEEEKYPPIKLIIAEGKEDITIKLSDEGGGIPRSGTPLIFTYLYTTAKPPEVSLTDDFKAPLAGLGYGLPISRQYARYFGGDLRIISLENYGTDAYLHLRYLILIKEAKRQRRTIAMKD
eukprot:NODE_95_length_21511_cov_0.501168.p5 type:complete len:389 gc:universal NODE_95_length_21511_cov_0.501168:6574-5408(-)